MQIIHIDLWGNTHPLKVDRNLQWMPYQPTNPTYIRVLLWTMSQLSVWPINSTTRLTIQTHIHKRHVWDIWHTVCQHCEYYTWQQYLWSQMKIVPNNQYTGNCLKLATVNVNCQCPCLRQMAWILPNSNLHLNLANTCSWSPLTVLIRLTLWHSKFSIQIENN